MIGIIVLIDECHYSWCLNDYFRSFKLKGIVMLYMDKAKKQKLLIVSFAPLIAFIATLGYEYARIGKLLAISDHHTIIDKICDCYNALVIMYGFSVLLTIFVLLYFIIHIAKIKMMNGATKILWIVFLAAFMPLSFVVFWYLQLKKEPRYLETKADIT